MRPLDLREAVRKRPVRVGRYEVRALIGEGGMGDVYDAVDTEHGGRVALKTLRDCDVDPGRLLLFKNEFRAVADLSHEHLVPLYELGYHDGLWFFTMERVDGVGLSTAMRRTLDSRSDTSAAPLRVQSTTPTKPTTVASPRARSGPRSRAQIPAQPAEEPACDLDLFVTVVAQVLDALEYLHQQGVVHQDLKPSNVLIDAERRVRLLDFGIAQRIGQGMLMRNDEAVIGTPDYMAPELWQGSPASPASDMFALGCVMFQLLSGFPPPADTTSHAPRTRRVERVVNGVPENIAAICARLLATEPGERPSIPEVRAALGVSPVPAPDAATPTRFVGRARERRALLAAVDCARAGGSAVALVEGGSGVGKSALLRSLHRHLDSQPDVLVLRGRCYERESVPYKAFDGMVDELAVRLAAYGDDELARVVPPWFGELAQVFPVLSGREPAAADIETISALELRRRVLESLYRLFEGLAREQTVVLEIDDLQWADADSLALLDRMVREPVANLLLALSVRPAESVQDPAVASYLEAVRGLPPERNLSIRLAPLDPADAEELARQTLRSLELSSELASPIALESGGVPFFVEELAHSVAQHRGSEDIAVRLDRALAERAGALPTAERALVEVLAVANNPIPSAVACEVAGVEGNALPVLAALHRGHFVRSAGVRAEDALGIYHDRMRESVLANLTEERTAAIHLALGRALADLSRSDTAGGHVFDAVRHLSAASSMIDDPAERLEAARLHLVAGNQARKAAAFPLAFRCFEDGIELLPAQAWATAYDTALGLHAGAAEAAYLTASWPSMERRINEVKQHSRAVLDQMPVWEVQIDALTGKQDLIAAVDAGLEALGLLDVRLPREPGEQEVAAAFARALEGLTQLGPGGLEALADAHDPIVLAAMRIQVRLCPVAFFVRQPLLVLMASNLVTTSIESGLSYATPNALALFGLIMNSANMHPVSHEWGELAIRMIDRWPDRSLEAATRHVVYNFVCPWVVPVRSILASSREVFDIGQRTGDFEYGSYAVHMYTYMAMAAGERLVPLRDDVLSLGRQMRAFGQFNAVSIHAPFEQLLLGLTGTKAQPWNLDGEEFSENRALAALEAAGSRSGLCVHYVATGMARYYFGRAAEASRRIEAARPYLDSVPSCWLVPLCHQFAALAGCAAWAELDPAARAALRPRLDESLDELRKLASHGPANFASRVSLVEAELLRIDGDLNGAVQRLQRALAQAAEHGALGEMALAHELMERHRAGLEQPSEAAEHRAEARALYEQWGAHGKAAQLA